MLSRVVGHNPMSPVLRQNLGDIGLAKVANCTDEEVHESSVNKKKWQQQAILDCIKRIEELALELLEYGFDTDEKITGLVAKGIEGGAKYKAAVLYRKEQARLSVLKTEAQFAADMGFAQAKTGGEIGLIADRYGIDIKFLQAGFKTQSAALEPQLKASADAKNQEAIARQQQEAYWKGETTTSGGQKTLSGGLFGSISKSLAGWFKV
ncbi:MAG: hypothetical protein JGK29_30705 [Microcoleus sp. PH2017_17_BER_D_A]|nr:hypothetical protein [Microcoleus sp. PH2017_17_BER_D_A]